MMEFVVISGGVAVDFSDNVVIIDFDNIQDMSPYALTDLLNDLSETDADPSIVNQVKAILENA